MGCTQRDSEREQYKKFREWLEGHTGVMSSMTEDTNFQMVLDKLDELEIEGIW